MYLLNPTTIYILIGILFAFIMEYSNEKLNEKDPIEDYVALNMAARLILILTWPIYLVVFLCELVKNLKNKK
tara:strand:+ start:1651 stop:1866 length:216 start_codon:yes stop_codon:yes gene_type:complete